MNEENARRLAARQERDRPKITEADVDTYRELHYPGSRAHRDEATARGIVEIPGDGYIAALSHERFHEWFGTVCDETCPHGFVPPKPRWWRRLFGRRVKLPRAEIRH